MELEAYKNLKFSERRELDKKAFANYYSDNYFDDFESDIDGGAYANFLWNDYEDMLTFNTFYGTEIHKKYLIPLLRKLKLEQIKKVSN